jgi:protoporphyrinogen oxidase
MAGKRVSVKIQPKKGSEEAFFAERDQHKLRELRKKAAEEATQKYCKEHKYHCFRCGTNSLAEIDEGNVKIDICVNENCGAIHLDPEELKKIIKDQGALSAAKNAFLSVFKK